LDDTGTEKTLQNHSELLWTEWDPIGLNEYKEARDEYCTYVPDVFKLKIDHTDSETIAQYLFKIETERMGLLGNIEYTGPTIFKYCANS